MYPKEDVGRLYETYILNQCTFSVTSSMELEKLFQCLVRLQCSSIQSLEVRRTYDHPVFGSKNDRVTLPELIMDARITLIDVAGMIGDMLYSTIQSRQHSPIVIHSCKKRD
jgi:hypothetical protein